MKQDVPSSSNPLATFYSRFTAGCHVTIIIQQSHSGSGLLLLALSSLSKQVCVEWCAKVFNFQQIIYPQLSGFQKVVE